MFKPFVAIISAPSGAGKSTMCRKLLDRRKDLRMSISCTTRNPRPGEKNGRHYFFVTREEFKKRIQRHDFLEWAEVHGEYYGTPRHFIEETIKKDFIPLLTIDIQGAAAIRRKLPDSVLIFIAPPSLESLRERMESRREPESSMIKRLADSREELAAAKNYDYIVVNEDLEKAVSQVDAILTAETLRISRQEKLDPVPLG